MPSLERELGQTSQSCPEAPGPGLGQAGRSMLSTVTQQGSGHSRPAQVPGLQESSGKYLIFNVWCGVAPTPHVWPRTSCPESLGDPQSVLTALLALGLASRPPAGHCPPPPPPCLETWGPVAQGGQCRAQCGQHRETGGLRVPQMPSATQAQLPRPVPLPPRPWACAPSSRH